MKYQANPETKEKYKKRYQENPEIKNTKIKQKSSIRIVKKRKKL